MNETKEAGVSPANEAPGTDGAASAKPSGEGGQAQQAQAKSQGGQAEQAKGEARPPEDPQLAATRLEVARLQQEVEASRKRIDELARAYQSVTQDREEFKARLTRERERMIDVEKGNVAVMLLEGIDELDRCLGASAQDNSPLAQGVRLIRDNLLAKVAAAGIERLQVVGKTYDPNLAEAVDMEVTHNADDEQKVVAEIVAGYKYKDRVIRPARVKVAKYIQPAQA
jgi:molecular chaperone GrpE